MSHIPSLQPFSFDYMLPFPSPANESPPAQATGWVVTVMFTVVLSQVIACAFLVPAFHSAELLWVSNITMSDVLKTKFCQKG
jgi:hypothetical protein